MTFDTITEEAFVNPTVALAVVLMASELYYHQETESPIQDAVYEHLLKFIQEKRPEHPWFDAFTEDHFSSSSIGDIIPKHLVEPAKQWATGNLCLSDLMGVIDKGWGNG